MTVRIKHTTRRLLLVAILLYFACFLVPDHWIRWSGPEADPTAPSTIDEYYFVAEMAESFTSPGPESLDWPGWLGHLALLAGFVLLGLGQSWWAVAAAILAVACALMRHLTAFTDGFLAGHYLWLASMVVLGIAGGVGVWLERNSRGVLS
jgi:hypothetical protein